MTVTVIWLLSSLVGAVAASYGLYEASLDLRSAAPLTNGRKLIAKQRFYAQLARLLGFSCWVVLGITALIAFNVPPDEVNPVVLLLLVPNILQTTIVLSDVIVGRRLRSEARLAAMAQALLDQEQRSTT